MGVLYDYFRASDSATVAQACASTGCRSPLTAGQFPASTTRELTTLSRSANSSR